MVVILYFSVTWIHNLSVTGFIYLFIYYARIKKKHLLLYYYFKLPALWWGTFLLKWKVIYLNFRLGYNRTLYINAAAAVVPNHCRRNTCPFQESIKYSRKAQIFWHLEVICCKKLKNLIIFLVLYWGLPKVTRV